MTTRRTWIHRALALALVALIGQQAWRHGHDYIFADKLAEIVPGKIYRGAWQKPWPMRRLVRDHKIKTVIALAHPPDNPMAVEERKLAEELGVRWVHIPIVDLRGDDDRETVSDKLEEAAAIVADPANQPVYFHCHHGINRTSMVQIAYRTMFCGWTMEQAHDEIARTFGLVTVSKGPDFRHMKTFYEDRVLPKRKAEAEARTETAAASRAETAPAR